MKLSEVNGERTFDVIAAVIEPIANIATDKQIDLFESRNAPEGVNVNDYAVARLTKGVPKLLKRHKEDIITILAAIAGTERTEYVAQLNLVKLTKDVLELINDSEFIELFTSAQSQT